MRLQRAERFPDVFVLYTPYGFRNNAPVDEKSATSWSIGALVSIPILNRNQGNIRRAQHNVDPDANRAYPAWKSRCFRRSIGPIFQSPQPTPPSQRLERGILPQGPAPSRSEIRPVRPKGRKTSSLTFNAQRDYNEVVRQYRDTLIRHRRSMLKLNTAVGRGLCRDSRVVALRLRERLAADSPLI